MPGETTKPARPSPLPPIRVKPSATRPPHALYDLPGEIVSGHADRQVVRVKLVRGWRTIVAYLKREHRVLLRDRLSAWLAGFGWVSKSVREARVIAALRRAGIPAPRCLESSEDARGRAALLIRGTPGAVDLRTFLYRQSKRPPGQRRELARRLGELLARVHSAGFDWPDISSKHILIRPNDLRFTLIDWQRSRVRGTVPRSVRTRELAALHAALADELASPRERLQFLRTYLAASGEQDPISSWVSKIQRHAARLQQRRAVRELRQPPRTGKSQRLRWLGGEHLCVTRAFWRECCGQPPAWLVAIAGSSVDSIRQWERTWRGRRVVLRQYPPMRRMRSWWTRLWRRHRVAAGPRQAALTFRLERHDLAAPEVLAFGQRPDGASFVLLRPRSGTIPLSQWLAHPHPGRAAACDAISQFRDRLREAGYTLRSDAALHLGGTPASPVLVDVDQVVRRRRRA